MREGAVLEFKFRVFSFLAAEVFADHVLWDERFGDEVGVGEVDAFGDAGGSGAVEEADDRVKEGLGIGYALPVERFMGLVLAGDEVEDVPMGESWRVKFMDSRMRTREMGTQHSRAARMATSLQSEEAMMRLDLPCLTWRASSEWVKEEDAAL